MPEKKSETLEVRLPHSQKRAFMEACAAEGTTASEAVRGFVGRFLDARTSIFSRPLKETGDMIRQNPRKSTAFGGVLASLAVIGSILTFPSAMAESRPEADFRRMDADGNRIVTLREFRAYHFGGDTENAQADGLFTENDTNEDGQLVAEEFVEAWERRHRDLFDALDLNADDKVGIEEWVSADGVPGAFVFGMTSGTNIARDIEPAGLRQSERLTMQKAESYAFLDDDHDGALTYDEFVD